MSLRGGPILDEEIAALAVAVVARHQAVAAIDQRAPCVDGVELTAMAPDPLALDGRDGGCQSHARLTLDGAAFDVEELAVGRQHRGHDLLGARAQWQPGVEVTCQPLEYTALVRRCRARCVEPRTW